MNKTNYILASGAVALALMTAAPALAGAHESSAEASVKSNVPVGLNVGSALHIGGDINKNNEGKGDRDNDNDTNKVEGNATSTAHRSLGVKNFLSSIGAAGAGVVTSINGATFTVKSLGAKATTTVTTNASSTYSVNGVATTSNALAVGSHVVLMGTSTSDTSITASMVNIFTRGWGFFKHFFSH